MEKICFIANKYPNPIEQNALVFVQQLVWSIADLGYECTVICPVAINYNVNYHKIPYYKEERTSKNNIIKIYFPKFIGFGQSKKICGINPAIFTTNLFTNTIFKTIKREKLSFNFIYGHFLTPSGIAAVRVGKKLNIPSFFAHGESTEWSIKQVGTQRAERELKSIKGVIAVSNRNKELLLKYNLVNKNKIQVFPNGYRSDRFNKKDRIQSRKKFNLPLDKFIVGFVGSFDDRKGILRLEKAIENINDVYFICAGKGKLQPTSKKCLFSGTVNNEDLPYFYSAMDAFVLPTKNEGCCNAIIEAMACGCPIISSNLSFNDDILNDKNSIRINPNDIDEIAISVDNLYKNSKKRLSMSKESLRISKDLTLEQRAKKIINFMNIKEK